MLKEQLTKMHDEKGFIAALDQSGGSTPKALKLYGIDESAYSNDEEMFDLVHQMRTRIIKSVAFDCSYILGAILFEDTMNRMIDGIYTADYLWTKKKIIPFLKIDKGLAEFSNGVELMRPMPELGNLLGEAVKKNIFGTKMRSVIKEPNHKGIKEVVEQQFEVAKQISSYNLMPIIEPEVDILSKDRSASEEILKEEILSHLTKLNSDVKVMLKLSIPVKDNLYSDLMKNRHVLRVVALSGGYSQNEANKHLASNHNLIASFSRALSEGLTAQQTESEFDATLRASVKAIFYASIA